jgi:hypothetical protein
MNDAFGYIKEHLDVKEQAIWELGEQGIHNSLKNLIYYKLGWSS